MTKLAPLLANHIDKITTNNPPIILSYKLSLLLNLK